MASIVLPDPPLTDGVVRLRPWRHRDIPAIVGACRDPEIGRWTSVPIDYSEENARAWLATHREMLLRGKGAALAITEAGSGEVVGSVGVSTYDWTHSVAEIGYWVGPQARRRGVATRAVRLICAWAFEHLGMARIELCIQPGNIASQRVAEKASFAPEGILRSRRDLKGRRVDLMLFSLVASDRALAPRSGTEAAGGQNRWVDVGVDN